MFRNASSLSHLIDSGSEQAMEPWVNTPCTRSSSIMRGRLVDIPSRRQRGSACGKKHKEACFTADFSGCVKIP